ncbi:D-alanyl-D-alanine dipeptidase [Flavobacterium lacus]|uniref:D-alanyl-D-alanine dipeptidase n=2 Tax=Flavobacterium lacus TaxID=1353778 RepID=A0A328WQ61_9FLAO|nr:D-alanyl-D-alanine dipeptidase [Flavobacterium lacus]
MSRILILFLFVITSSYGQELKEVPMRQSVNDTVFVNLKDYSNDFVYDMRYATENNFLNAKVYDCAECFLRFKTVKKLIEANQKFNLLGYTIKLYDCYRPLDVQKKMWAIVSNPIYVADPKKGSIHNRGGAVDLTLVDKNGVELVMGTDFDHFGKEAAHTYQDFSNEVLQNRKILREIMESCSFKVFQSEWWHYNLQTDESDKLSNFKWDCN